MSEKTIVENQSAKANKTPTCIFVDDISPLNVSRDRLDAGFLGAHFLEKCVVGLQVQHARTFSFVRWFYHIIGNIVPNMMIWMMKICAGQYYVWIIIATNDIWLFSSTIFCYYFYMSFMTGTWWTGIIFCVGASIIVIIIAVVIYIKRINYYFWILVRGISQNKVTVRIEIVNYNIFSWYLCIFLFDIEFIICSTKYVKIIVVWDI